MSEFLKQTFRCCIFIFVQVFILNEIPPLHRYVSPYLYFLFILWLPFRTPRLAQLLIGFIYGLVLDAFMYTPGLHAASCTLMAFMRPSIISILLPKEVGETGYPEPSYKSMGFIPYGTYIVLMTLSHHLYLTLLEWLQFGGFLIFLLKVFASTGVSLLLVLITEMIFSRKSSYRTNVA
jgi:rod shape-determining protein MreD